MTLLLALTLGPLLLSSPQGPSAEELAWLQSVAKAPNDSARDRVARTKPEWRRPASLLRLAQVLRASNAKERQAWLEAGRGLLLLAATSESSETHAHALWTCARLESAPQTKSAAIGLYQQAIDRFAETGNPHVADCLIDSAELDLRFGGMIEQMTAQARLQRARSAFRAQGKREGEIRCLFGIAEADVALGNLVAAERALAEAKELSTGPVDRDTDARAAFLTGAIARERRQFAAALEALRHAKEGYTASKNHDALARCLELEAWVYSAKGDREQQYAALRRFVELREAIGDPWGIAEAKQGIADFLADLGRGDEAAEAILEAAGIFRRLGAGLQEAQCNLVCGETFALNGRFGEAFRFLEQARAVLEERRDLVGISRYHLAMGTLLAEVGRPREAIEMYQKAIPFFRQIRARRNEAVAYLNASVSLRQLGEIERARNCLERAMTIFDELGDVSDRALTLLNLGQLDLRENQRERAEQRLGEARKMFESVGNEQRVAACDLALGNLAFRARDWALAKTRLERADASFARVGDRSKGAYTAALLGRVAQAGGRLADAIGHFERAMNRLEGLRSVLDPEIAAGASDGLTRLTSDLALAYLDAGKPEEAFAAAQRGKGALLRQALLGTRLQPRPIDEKDRREIRRLQLAYDLAAGPAKERKLAELDAFLAQVRARHPVFGKLDARPASLGAIAKALPAKTALVEYIQGPDQAAALVLIGGKSPSLTAHRIALTQSEASALVDGLDAAEREFDQWASRIYGVLITPLSRSLRDVQALILCPDGVLHSLPFAALRSPAGKYLIEEYAIVAAPSASAWEACRTVANRPRDRSRSALVVVRSRFQPEAATTGLRGGSPLPDLPGAKEESGAVRQALGRGVVELAENRATVAAFRRQAPSARLLHFATHALPNSVSPMLGALALASTGDADPGLLYARDIYEMQLHAELTVLSACGTGQGRVAGGEGLLGLGWAFLVAGCPNTVATRWDLGDRAGRVWVEAFYRNLSAGKKPAEAYRAACLEALRSRSYSSPRHWGAWVLIGAG